MAGRGASAGSTSGWPSSAGSADRRAGAAARPDWSTVLRVPDRRRGRCGSRRTRRSCATRLAWSTRVSAPRAATGCRRCSAGDLDARLDADGATPASGSARSSAEEREPGRLARRAARVRRRAPGRSSPTSTTLLAAGVPDLRLATLAGAVRRAGRTRMDVEPRFRDAVPRVRDLVDQLASYGVGRDAAARRPPRRPGLREGRPQPDPRLGRRGASRTRSSRCR